MYNILKIYYRSMTCYFRHMKEIFNEIDVDPTKENKKDIDRKIHSILGVEYKNCSSTWRLVKASLAENREGFIQQLRKEIAGNTV